jgi:effector-binding domain-containing protein
MKIIKRIISILLILIALLAIATLFTPSSLQLEESIVIDASPEMIYEEILDFKSWSNWSLWHQIDPEMKNYYSDTLGIIGSFNRWESNHDKVGNGKQTITELEEYSLIKTKMEFGGYESKDYSAWYLTPENDGKTLLRWTFEGSEMPFYMRLISALFVENMIRDAYIIGLNQLKDVVESKPKTVALPENVSIENVDAAMILSILDSTDANGVGDKLTNLYRDILVFATIKEMNQSGAQMAYYHYYSPEKVILEAAIPFEGDLSEDGRIKLKEKKGEKVLKGVFYGNYDQTGKMHEIMGTYIEEAKLQINNSPYEVYITDPSTEADTSKWKTEVYYPIE